MWRKYVDFIFPDHNTTLHHKWGEIRMRIEAQKVENGFLIPFVDGLKTIKRDKILLEVTLIEQEEDEIDRFFNRYQINLSEFRFDREEANAR
jgi:hypothetical protein